MTNETKIDQDDVYMRFLEGETYRSKRGHMIANFVNALLALTQITMMAVLWKIWSVLP